MTAERSSTRSVHGQYGADGFGIQDPAPGLEWLNTVRELLAAFIRRCRPSVRASGTRGEAWIPEGRLVWSDALVGRRGSAPVLRALGDGTTRPLRRPVQVPGGAVHGGFRIRDAARAYCPCAPWEPCLPAWGGLSMPDSGREGIVERLPALPRR